jgi:hypothetical protein
MVVVARVVTNIRPHAFANHSSLRAQRYCVIDQPMAGPFGLATVFVVFDDRLGPVGRSLMPCHCVTRRTRIEHPDSNLGTDVTRLSGFVWQLKIRPNGLLFANSLAHGT